MISPLDGFSPDYARARVQFLEAAAAAGMAIRSHNHPLLGMAGETLAVDVALDGPADAERLLVVSSACHGVEGFCGSGVQVFAAHDEAWREHAREAGVAVLYIHALNPHGFSHLRRVTEDNVDLNRNFHNFDAPLPVNADYAEIHGLLNSETWPPSAENEAGLRAYIAQHGMVHAQAALSQGQHAFPDGLYFGGTEAAWSNTTLRQILQEHGQVARHMAWIDVHSGLGPEGVGERIFAGKPCPEALARAQAWWGGGGSTPVTSVEDGSSSSAYLTGTVWAAIGGICPQASFTAMALEFGTVSVMAVFQALRADHWLHGHPAAPAAVRELIQQGMRDAFYVDTDVWRAQVVVQARQAMFQAVDGLGRAA